MRLSCLLAVSLALAAVGLPFARGAVDGVSLSSPDYVVGSTAVVSVAVTGSPPYPDATVTWKDAGGTVRRSVTLPVPTAGGLADAFDLDTVGAWSVTATAGPITANHSLEVLPATMSASFSLPRDTVIGGNAAWVLQAGTIVDIGPGVRLVVRGSLESQGTVGAPVTLRASGTAWQGIEVPLGGNVLLAGTDLSGATVGIEASGDVVASGGSLEASAVGVSLLGGQVSLDGVAVTAPTGVFAAGGSLTIHLTSIASTTAIAGTGASLLSSGSAFMAPVAWDLTQATLSSTDDEIGPAGAQVLLDESVATLERVRLPEAVSFAIAQSTVLVGNGTFLGPTAGFSVRSGRATILQTPWPASARAIITEGSLELRSLLTVEASGYEDSAAIAGAEVSVEVDGTPVWNGTTGADGRTVPLSLPYKVWAPSPHVPVTRVSVASGSLRFGFNHRTVDLRTSGTAAFAGSLADNDLDGEPDFADVDDDNDGLTDTREQQISTNPFLADTDFDGLPDYWEWFHDHGATLANADADLDGDGLTAHEEYDLGTFPRAVDTDADGAGDGWEVSNGFDPSNAADGLLDADADGATNAEEAKAGTDPRQATSHPDRPVVIQSVWGLALLAVIGGTLTLVGARLLGRRAARRKTEPLRTRERMLLEIESPLAPEARPNPFEDLEEVPADVPPFRSPILLPIGSAAEAARGPVSVPDVRPVPRTTHYSRIPLGPSHPATEDRDNDAPEIRIVPALPLPEENPPPPPPDPPVPEPPAAVSVPETTPPPPVFHAPTRSERRQARREKKGATRTAETKAPETPPESYRGNASADPGPTPSPGLGSPSAVAGDTIVEAPGPDPSTPPVVPVSTSPPTVPIPEQTSSSPMPPVEGPEVPRPEPRPDPPSEQEDLTPEPDARAVSPVVIVISEGVASPEKPTEEPKAAIATTSLSDAHAESLRDLALDTKPKRRTRQGRSSSKAQLPKAPTPPRARRSSPPKPLTKALAPSRTVTAKPRRKPSLDNRQSSKSSRVAVVRKRGLVAVIRTSSSIRTPPKRGT